MDTELTILPHRTSTGERRRPSAPLPTVWPGLLRWFVWYSQRYLARNFHALRVLRVGWSNLEIPADVPLVVYMNHPAWWDPLVGLVLSRRLTAERTAYAPMDARALARYRFFQHLGFFGIETDSPRGAIAFARTSRTVLSAANTALWITAQGQFTDPRTRPVELRPGLGHLARDLKCGWMLPLAVEYPFWEERFPEALVAVGEPTCLESSPVRSAAEWTTFLAAQLEATQDRLAEAALRRRRDDFITLVRGRAGIGGLYDLGRRVVAWCRGEAFRAEHGGDDPA